MCIFDEKAQKLVELNGDMMLNFFINNPLPAGVLEFAFDEQFEIVDLQIVLINQACSDRGIFGDALRSLKADAPISGVFGKWMAKDLGFDRGDVNQWISEMRSQFGVQHVSDRVTIHSDFSTIMFPLSITKFGFISEDLKQRKREVDARDVELAKKCDELKSSNAKFQRLNDSNIIGCFTVKISGQVLEANDKALEILGYCKKDLDSGKLDWVQWTPVEWLKQDYEEIVPKLLTIGSVSAFEKEYFKADGTRIPVQVGVALFEFFPGNFAESTVICYLIDLTERKRIERDLMNAKEAAIQASKAKSAFLSTMSHELRTPLSGIIGSQALLLETNLDANQRDLVEAAHRSGEGLLSLLADVLDLSKIESGKLELQPVAFDLRPMIEDSLELLGELANRKNLELVAIFDPDPVSGEPCPKSAIADFRRIRQILFNLVGNAIKFTNDGGVTVRVSLLPAKVRIRRQSTVSIFSPASIETEEEPEDIRNRSTVQAASHAIASAGAVVEALAGMRLRPPSPDHDHYQEQTLLATPGRNPLSEAVHHDIEEVEQNYVCENGCHHGCELPKGKECAECDDPCPVSEIPIVACSDGRKRLLIEVKDTGVGIPDAQKSKIFAAFSQIDASASRRFEGCGLGLSISKQLVILLGGSVGFISTQGKGTTFFFDVPFEEVEQQTPGQFPEERIHDESPAILAESPSSPSSTSGMSKANSSPIFSRSQSVYPPLPNVTSRQWSLVDQIPPNFKVPTCVIYCGDYRCCALKILLPRMPLEIHLFKSPAQALKQLQTELQQISSIIVCLHEASLQSGPCKALQYLANSADDQMCEQLHVILAGPPKTFALLKYIENIERLQICTISKPMREHRLLNAIYRAHVSRISGLKSGLSSSSFLSSMRDVRSADDSEITPSESMLSSSSLPSPSPSPSRSNSSASPFTPSPLLPEFTPIQISKDSQLELLRLENSMERAEKRISKPLPPPLPASNNNSPSARNSLSVSRSTSPTATEPANSFEKYQFPPIQPPVPSQSTIAEIHPTTMRRYSAEVIEDMNLIDRPESSVLHSADQIDDVRRPSTSSALYPLSEPPPSRPSLPSLSSSPSCALPAPAPPPISSEPATPMTLQEALASTTVLLAEDSVLLAKITSRQVEKAGATVDLAANGQEAVDAQRDRMLALGFGYDIILMDLMMPLLSGTEATAKIREMEKERGLVSPTQRSFIIALTADVNPGTKESCIEAGCNLYVSKPMSAKVLDEVLRTALQTRGFALS